MSKNLKLELPPNLKLLKALLSFLKISQKVSDLEHIGTLGLQDEKLVTSLHIPHCFVIFWRNRLAHKWKSGQLEELVLSFHHVGAGDLA